MGYCRRDYPGRWRLSPAELVGLLRGIGIAKVPRLTAYSRVKYEFSAFSHEENKMSVFAGNKKIGEANYEQVMGFI